MRVPRIVGIDLDKTGSNLAEFFEVGNRRQMLGVILTRRLCFVLLLLIGVPPVLAANDRIAVVKSREIEPYEIALKGFNETLRAKGYDPEVREYLLPTNDGNANTFLAGIRQQEPGLILSLGSAATSQISKAVHDTPIVFCMVLNPVASGFVRSMEASGNNLTGAALDLPARTQFEALRSILPSVRRIGVIYNPRETGSVVQQAAKAAEQMGLELVPVSITSEERVPEALKALDKKIDALWSVADSTAFSSGSVEFILLHTLRNKIPFVGLSPGFVKAGALMALAVDYSAVGQQCGEQAVKVLSRHPPSSLPVTTPQHPILHINLKTAATIGLEIPPDRLQGAVVVE